MIHASPPRSRSRASLVSPSEPSISSVSLADSQGYRTEPLLASFMVRYADAYRQELTAFVEALESGDPLSPAGEDGLRALELADAAQRSMETGRLVRPGA